MKRGVPVEVVEQFEHGPLHLSVSAFVVVETLGSYGVDLVDKDDGGSFLFGQGEGIAHHFGTVSDVHLHKVGAGQFEEGGFGLACTCTRHHRLSCSGGAEHEAAFGRTDTDGYELFLMGDGKDDGLTQLFDLLIESSNISVLFRGFFLELHRFHA